MGQGQDTVAPISKEEQAVSKPHYFKLGESAPGSARMLSVGLPDCPQLVFWKDGKIDVYPPGAPVGRVAESVIAALRPLLLELIEDGEKNERS